MKCEKCKSEVDILFTSDDYKQVCRTCLEKEIYKKRKKIVKKYKEEKNGK